MSHWKHPTERWPPNEPLDSSNGASYFPMDRWNFRRSVGTSQRAVGFFQGSVVLSDEPLELPTERWSFPTDRWILPTERRTFRWPVGTSDGALELPNEPLDSFNGASDFPIGRWNLPMERRTFRWPVGFFQRSVGTSQRAVGLFQRSVGSIRKSVGLPDERLYFPVAVFRAKGARSLSPAHRAGTTVETNPSALKGRDSRWQDPFPDARPPRLEPQRRVQVAPRRTVAGHRIHMNPRHRRLTAPGRRSPEGGRLVAQGASPGTPVKPRRLNPVKGDAPAPSPEERKMSRHGGSPCRLLK